MLRKNDPVLLILLFILIMGLRLFLLIPEIPVTPSLMKYFVVGEKLSGSDFRLYTDVWTDLSPLSAWTYMALDYLFGRSVYAHVFISGILVYAQSLIFSDTLRRYDVMTEKNYLHAYIYAGLMHLSFEFLFLSPALICNTFLLLFVRAFFKLNKEKSDSDLFYVAGMFFGMAVLARYSAILLLIFALPAIVLYSKASLRQSIIFVLGVLFPSLFLYFYYFWHGETSFLFFNFFGSLQNHEPDAIHLHIIRQVYLLPGCLFLLAVIVTYKSRYFVSFQDVCRQSMLLWVIFCIPLIFYSKNPDSTVYMPACIGMSLFISDLFILKIKNRLIPVVKTVMWAGLAFTFWAGIITFRLPYTRYSYHIAYPAMHQQPETEKLLKDKKILVLGESLLLYRHSVLATPYMEFELSKKHLLHSGNIKAAAQINDNFIKDMPEAIVDEHSILPRLAVHLPLLTARYQKVSDNIYILKKDTKLIQ